MARKLFATLGLLFLTSVCRASIFDLWLASHSSTSDTAQVILSSPCAFNAICVNRASAAGGQVVIYNSSSTNFGVNVSTLAILDGTVKSACSTYNTYMSQGLTYTSTGTTPADITILYNRWSH